MSNLGWYQILTTAAKAVGGPKKLVGLLIAGGAVVGTAIGTGGTLLTQKVISTRRIKKKTKTITYLENGKVFTVSTEYSGKNGLELRVGDQYKVLSRDADAILIEIIGNEDNPHLVSDEFLRKISDFV